MAYATLGDEIEATVGSVVLVDENILSVTLNSDSLTDAGIVELYGNTIGDGSNYVSLHIGRPAVGNEIIDNNYIRQVFNASLDESPSVRLSNDTEINYATAVADYNDPVIWVGIWTAERGGTCIASIELDSPIQVNAGQRISFPVGSIYIDIANGISLLNTPPIQELVSDEDLRPAVIENTNIAPSRRSTASRIFTAVDALDGRIQDFAKDATTPIPAGVKLENQRFTETDRIKFDAIESGAHVNIGQEYTQAEKDKLADIEDNAERNIGVEFTQAEKTKLDEIEGGAHVNVGEEYTEAEKTKLSNIETGATADQDNNEIVAAVDAVVGNTAWKTGQANVGVEYTQAEKDKAAGSEASAKDDQTGEEIEGLLDTRLGSNAWRTGNATVATGDTIDGNGSSKPLDVNGEQLDRLLFGNYDVIMPNAASVNYSVPAAPGNFDWRRKQGGTVANVIGRGSGPAGTIRGKLRLSITSTSGGVPVQWRVRFYDITSQSLGPDHFQHLTTDDGGTIGEVDFAYDYPAGADLLLVQPQVVGVGAYAYNLRLTDITSHTGDGVASHSVRAEIARDTAELHAMVGTAYDNVTQSGRTLDFQRVNGEDGTSVTVPERTGGEIVAAINTELSGNTWQGSGGGTTTGITMVTTDGTIDGDGNAVRR